jgi:hypothetical protein
MFDQSLLSAMGGREVISRRKGWIGQFQMGNCALFNVVEVEVLTRIISDHHPIQVTFSNSRERVWQRCRHFKFEAAWTCNKE